MNEKKNKIKERKNMQFQFRLKQNKRFLYIIFVRRSRRKHGRGWKTDGGQRRFWCDDTNKCMHANENC